VKSDEKRGHRVRTIFTAIVLTALWLLMSGLYKPMILGFGAASVILVVYVVRRMDAVDGDQFAIRLKPIAFLGYMVWLLVEIAKSNWAVTKIVLSPQMPIRQHMFDVPCSQETDLGQVIFASSITLTPGTISVETEEGHFQVHALDYGDDDMDALADMDARVTAVDGGRA
jgi:multicomponent Na+:H+ antiporter subunit E